MSTASALILTLALAANSDVVLLDFSAQWCGPCRVMEPAVERLVTAGYPVRKIDVDRNAKTASRFRVTNVPCFVMLVNGQEVDRVTGAVSYDRLLQMYGKARVRPIQVATGNARSAASDRPLASRGSTAGTHGKLVRAQSPDGPSEPDRQPPSSSFSSTARHAQTTRHTTNAPPAGIDPSAVRAAFQATVRLKVEDPQGSGFGTGTIIDSHGDEALVVTCGHLFRESAGKGVIHVDLFSNGQPRTVPGQLISYDLERDIALVSITPGQAVVPVKVAASGRGIARNVPVFSIGCDKGAAPSVRESQVTAIDRYLGPPNIEVAGQPIDGRSGGGLFSADGRLIGICNAADPADDEGIYAGLPTIHWELDRIGQRRIYASTAPAAGAPGMVAQASAAATAPRQPSAAQASPPTMPDRMVVPTVASQVSHTAPPIDRMDPDTEVICIIRSRNDPQGQQRLLVLDHPSADLLNRLRLESQPGAPAASIARQPAAPQRRSSQPVIRAQSADR